MVVFLIEGATRYGYDPLRQPVSALALGPLGWVQQLNFIVTGILMVAGAIGLRTALQRWGGSNSASALIALAGIGLVGAGIFVMGGALHIPFSLLFFVGMPAACIVLGSRFGAWGQRNWAWYSILSGIASLIAFAMTFVALGLGGLSEMAGLIQRVTAGIGFTWLTALSMRMLTLRGT